VRKNRPAGGVFFCSTNRFAAQFSAMRSKLAGEAACLHHFWTYHGRAVDLVAGHFSLLFFSNPPLACWLGETLSGAPRRKSPIPGQEPHQKQTP